MRCLLAALLLTICPHAHAEAPSPAAAWAVDDITWQRIAPNGTRYALLEGSREQAGASFTYAFFIPAGVWDSVHSHSQTARIFVARGALRIGYGAHADQALAKTYHAGDMVLVPAGAQHFDGADVDTIILGVSSAPWSTEYLDGSKPASAGTPAR